MHSNGFVQYPCILEQPGRGMHSSHVGPFHPMWHLNTRWNSLWIWEFELKLVLDDIHNVENDYLQSPGPMQYPFLPQVFRHNATKYEQWKLVLILWCFILYLIWYYILLRSSQKVPVHPFLQRHSNPSIQYPFWHPASGIHLEQSYP